MNTQQENNSEETSAIKLLNRLFALSICGVLIAGAVVALYFWQFHGSLSVKPDAWGQFGDFIGGTLNPTFSMLALIALLATFTLQIQEFRLSTKELRNSAAALSAQHYAMQRQIFENTFFQLLSLHNQILDNIDLRAPNGNESKGRDCFTVFVHRANNSIRAVGDATNDLLQFRKAYQRFLDVHEREISHYFRTLYNLIKFIDASKGIDAKFYTNIVRAQLSSHEVTLLMYNCMSDAGFIKFKPLVEKYALLKGLTDLYLSPELVESVYDVQAFGIDHSQVYLR